MSRGVARLRRCRALVVAAAVAATEAFAQERPARPPEPKTAVVGRPGWSVDPRSGCWLWNANPRPGETVEWSGSCDADGPASGRGVLTFRFQLVWERLEGEFKDGKANGRIIWTGSNGVRYDGEMLDGRRHGRGVLTSPKGDRYEGEFREGVLHGRGVFVNEGGFRYDGEWLNGRPHGSGTAVYAGGNRYQGGYLNGLMSGRGIFEFANGDRYDGEMQNDQLHGRGTMHYTDGRRVEGEWRRGRRVESADAGAAAAEAPAVPIGDLFAAIRARSLRDVERLLDRGAAVDLRNNFDATPLISAATAGSLEIVRLLVARGADVNAKTRSQFTALHWAANWGDREMAELLLAKGASLDPLDAQGRTPLAMVLTAATVATPKWFAMMAKRRGLDAAAERKLREDLKGAKAQWRELAVLLIERGADVRAGGKDEPPLYVAVNLGYLDLVRALLDRGADMNDATTGETALHAAIAEKHKEIAELLIAKGANLNARNMSGRTPLHFVARDLRDAALAQSMIERGADPDLKDKEGDTALVWAARSANRPVQELLLVQYTRSAVRKLGPSAVPREQALAAMVDKTAWPNSRRMIELLRAEIPERLVAHIGRSERLGPAWRPGNPHWERARGLVEELLREEEAKRGPLLPLDPRGVAASISETEITDDEIRVLAAYLDSPHGRNSITFLDHALVAMLMQQIAESAEPTDDTKARAVAIGKAARDNFQEVLRRFNESAKANKVEDAWFGALMERLGGERRGKQFGREIFLDRPGRRMLEVFLFGGFAAVRAEIEAFRRTVRHDA